MNFKLVVFDWDGTLMDSEARIVDSMRGALGDLDRPLLPPERIRDIIGLGLREAVCALLPGEEESVCARVVERYRHHYLIANRTPTALFPGAREVVEELGRQGYLLAVATGKGRQGLDQAMRATGMESMFHATRCADEALSKPHPQMLLELMDELGAFPGETLMIGDTEFDMQLAANAGTRALAVGYGVHERERLLRHGPLDCLESVGEIPGWLEQTRKTAVELA